MTGNVLILDTETTGLDPNKGAKLIEIGALLYNVKEKVVIQTLAFFLPCDENPVQDINNIKVEWTNCNTNTSSAFAFLRDMAKNCYAVIAHNAEFDKKFLRTRVELNDEFWSKKWICTKKDFTWPVQLFRNRLQDVCAAMEVDYVDAHRALTDCDFIAKCFSKVADLEFRLRNATTKTFSNSKTYR